jgi:hypothetical protein
MPLTRGTQEKPFLIGQIRRRLKPERVLTLLE